MNTVYHILPSRDELDIAFSNFDRTPHTEVIKHISHGLFYLRNVHKMKISPVEDYFVASPIDYDKDEITISKIYFYYQILCQ